MVQVLEREWSSCNVSFQRFRLINSPRNFHNKCATFFSIGPVRKGIWRLWYPFLTRRLQEENVVFLNYAFETDPPAELALEPADEPDRACIQLYHHVASQADLRGREVLEVSCGHGGGASWITRRMRPSRFTGLDLNRAYRAWKRFVDARDAPGDTDDSPQSDSERSDDDESRRSRVVRGSMRALNSPARIRQPLQGPVSRRAFFLGETTYGQTIR